MAILIDGYNLLFASGRATPPGWRRSSRTNQRAEPAGTGVGELQAGRASLLRFLAQTLPARQRQATTIVFDAPGRHRQKDEAEYTYRGIRVRYAVEYEEADDLIEQMIAKAPNPRKLTVVSSDQRIQAAARRRNANIVDSDSWLMYLEHERHEPTEREANPTDPTDHHTAQVPADSDGPRRTVSPTDQEVQRWLAEFDEAEEKQPSDARSDKDVAPRAKKEPSSGEEQAGQEQQARRSEETSTWDPFPPGYADDLDPFG